MCIVLKMIALHLFRLRGHSSFTQVSGFLTFTGEENTCGRKTQHLKFIKQHKYILCLPWWIDLIHDRHKGLLKNKWVDQSILTHNLDRISEIA